MKLIDKLLHLTVAAAVMLAILWVDKSVGVQISLWVMYCLPIGWSTWNRGRMMGLITAVMAVLFLMATALIWGHLLASWTYFGFSLASRAVIYIAVVLLIAEVRKRQVERVFVPPRSRQRTSNF